MPNSYTVAPSSISPLSIQHPPPLQPSSHLSATTQFLPPKTFHFRPPSSTIPSPITNYPPTATSVLPLPQPSPQTPLLQTTQPLSQPPPLTPTFTTAMFTAFELTTTISPPRIPPPNSIHTTAAISAGFNTHTTIQQPLHNCIPLNLRPTPPNCYTTTAHAPSSASSITHLLLLPNSNPSLLLHHSLILHHNQLFHLAAVITDVVSAISYPSPFDHHFNPLTHHRAATHFIRRISSTNSNSILRFIHLLQPLTPPCQYLHLFQNPSCNRH